MITHSGHMTYTEWSHDSHSGHMTYTEWSHDSHDLQMGSHDLPGRNPGTSTKVINGIPKASQKRMNLAPLMDDVMSKQPIERSHTYSSHMTVT